MLIAVKEGITVFRGGTIFEVEGATQYKKSDGSIRECFELPDDGMGRLVVIETKDTIVCGEQELRGAEAGHGRCNFSKQEIIHPGSEPYAHDFSPRSVSFEKDDTGWNLIWRIPGKGELKKESHFQNKVTRDITKVEADCKELEYDEISISTLDYKQTLRKRRAPHYIWNLYALKPGFYSADLDLGNSFIGRVHFIKHYPVQLANKDPRETAAVHEVSFSEELWNSALKTKLAWGPESRIPFQVRLLELHPELGWEQANFLEKICNDTLSFVWSIYEKKADGKLSLSEVRHELIRTHPWIDEERHAQLKVLGEYYAKFKR